MNEKNKIKCPSCGTAIDVSEILYHQIQEQLNTEYSKKKDEEEQEYQKKLKELDREKEKVKKAQESFNEQVEKEVLSKVSAEKSKLEASIKEKLNIEVQDQISTMRKELEEKTEKVKELNQSKAEIEKLKREKDELKEQISIDKEKEFVERIKAEKEKMSEAVQQQIAAMKTELDAKTEKVKELNQSKAEVERLKREKDELRDTINLEKEKEYNELIKAERERIQKNVEEHSQMRFKEIEKQLEDQKKLVDEMKRKAEQGSMQLQGEVQEIALRDFLQVTFPIDEIKDVPVGTKGADLIHVVRNRMGVDCGTIIYESKRTKAFANDWISKLKNDAVIAKADISIIVSEALPDDIDRIGLKDGVWICSYPDLKSLVVVIREGMMKVHEAVASQTNKGEKMEMLYNYLTGNEFALQVGAILDGFSALQKGYLQEKKAMEKIWKQREKQLERVLLNTSHFVGSIKGIAGITIQEVKQLEVDDNPLDEVD